MSNLQLDNSLLTYEDRLKLVDQEIERIGEDKLTVYNKAKIADYLIDASGVKPRGEIITSNRMVTVTKRETSREGLVDKLEGGESAFHSLIRQDKNVILTPKVEITQEDILEVPGLAQLRAEIDKLEKLILDNPDMDIKKRGMTKKTLIEMRRDQYVLKNAYRQPIFGKGGSGGGDLNKFSNYDLTLHDPGQVSVLLLNYSGLKEEFSNSLESDIKWILEDLDNLILESLEDKPSLMYILVEKISGASNIEIREGLIERYGIDHTQEYISSLYRNKIPQTIADKAVEKWIDYMYIKNIKGTYKTCSRCKEVKLASNRNFSINRTSSSQFYSICKKCRNTKK